MLKVSRRFLLSSAVAVAVLSGPVAGNAFGRRANGVITTITLVNTSQNTMPDGSVTQLIGCPFKKGDLPKGAWPLFQLPDGTDVPCTLLNALATRWSDGSLKFVPAMLSIPLPVAGGNSLTVNVLNGGNVLPPKSPRSLSDFSNKITPQVQVTGLDNLSGNWVMSLPQGIKSKTKVVCYGNGRAGAVWKVRANAQQNGNNHGQLVCDFYVASLANPDGSLKGLRILGKVKLPYYDTASTMNWMSFSRFQLCLNGSGTLIRDCFGTNFGSVRAYTFSWQYGNVFAANHGYSTANGHDYAYCTRLTTTGILPGGLQTNTSYFTAQRLTQTTICFSTNTAGQSTVSATDGGVGTHTATPYPYLCYFGSIYTAGPAGMWDFVQGAGSDPSDTALRCTMNPAYWVSTGLIPPYDITIPANSNNPTSYWPNSAEPAMRYLSTTGERDDLGIMPSWYARHFLTQAPVDEQVVRVMSLVGSQFAIGLENSATGTYPCVNNGSNGLGQAYSGMPAPNPGFHWCAGIGTTQGFPNGDTTNPNVRTAAFSEQDTTHMPQFNYYPYLFSGEPWHLDMLLEHANSAVYGRIAVVGVANISNTSFALGSQNGGGVRNLTVGTKPTFYGITVGDSTSQQRTDAWASALLVAAAGICPDKHPECAAYKQYFGNMNSATWAAAVAIINALPSFPKLHGLWSTPWEQGDVTPSWQMAYLGAAVGLACTATENKNALTALRSHVKWFDYVVSTFGGWHVGSYHTLARTGGGFAAPLVNSGACVAFVGPNLNWAAGGHFTLTPFSNYTPSDGDTVVFSTDQVTPAGFSNYVPYYMVNLNGDQFDLATSPSGGAIALTDTYDGGDQFYIVSTARPLTGSMTAIGNPTCYNSEALGMLNYALAVGAAVQPGTISDLSYRSQHAGTNYSTDPKWGFKNTFIQ